MPAGSLWIRAGKRLGVASGTRVVAVCMSAEPILAALARQGADVCAYDWHWRALRAAAANLPGDRLIPWDGSPIEPAGHFDVALCDLAHLSGRIAFTDAVRLAARALRPEGRLLVRGDNGEGIGGAARRLGEWFGAAEPIAYGGGGRIIAAPAGSPAGNIPAAEPCGIVKVEVGGVRLDLRRAPAVFAEGLPDFATHLLADTLAQHRAEFAASEIACDVGSGGGALGLCLLSLGLPRCVLVDENLRALAAVRANLRLNGMEERAEAVPGDAAVQVPGGRYGLLACNPPFHEGPHEDRGLGRAIVRRCWEATAPGGSLFVVGHGFLRYDRDVPELLAVASANGFTVRRGRRPLY